MRRSPLLFTVLAVAALLGGPALVAAHQARPAASPAADRAGVAGDAYASPTFGWRLTWDADGWAVEDAWSREGTDRLRLGTGAASVHFSAHRAHGGDAAGCIRQPIAFRPTQPGTTDVRVAEGPSGDAARTWVVLTFVYEEEDGGRAWAIREYAECRALVPGEAVLVVDFLAVADEYDDQFPLLEELLAAIVMPGRGTPLVGTPVP